MTILKYHLAAKADSPTLCLNKSYCYQFSISQEFWPPLRLGLVNHIENVLLNLIQGDLGPFRYCEKDVYFDKFSVITNILQVGMVCRDLTTFKRITDKICLG